MSKSTILLDRIISRLREGNSSIITIDSECITIDSEYTHGFHYCSDGTLRASKDANPRPDCPFCKLEIARKCLKKS